MGVVSTILMWPKGSGWATPDFLFLFSYIYIKEIIKKK